MPGLSRDPITEAAVWMAGSGALARAFPDQAVGMFGSGLDQASRDGSGKSRVIEPDAEVGVARFAGFLPGHADVGVAVGGRHFTAASGIATSGK
jgi:hypothetical protein